MTTSAVIDWAFASALGIGGKEMNAFLRARGDLRRAKIRGRRIVDALRSAEALGRWARVYYIPELCAIVRVTPATQEATIAKRVLLGLLVGEEIRLRDSLDSAVRDATGGIGHPGDFSSLDRAAERWLDIQNPSDFGELLDYTDIELFAPPIIILSLLLWSGITSEEATADPAFSPLGRVTSHALSGDYGRLAFLLAVDLALSRRARSELNAVGDAFRRALSSSLREKIVTSPDILARLVRLRFEWAEAEHAKDEFVRDLAQEAICLTGFRELFTGSRDQTLGLPFWHDAIFNVMFEAAPAEAANLLRSVWLPRLYKRGTEPPIEVPLEPVPDDLAALLRLASRLGRRDPTPADIVSNVSAGLSGSGLLLSPWLPQCRWSKTNWAGVSAVERCRWLCGLSLDLLVLEQLDIYETLLPFALHLLGSLETLKRYRNYEGPRGEAWEYGDTIGGVGNLSWLARATWETALETLSGEGRADRESIVAILEEACDSNFVFPGIEAPDFDAGLSHDWRRALASGGLRLVENGLSASSDGTESGWLEIGDRILSLHAPLLEKSRGLKEDDVLHGLISQYQQSHPSEPAVRDAHILDEVSGVGGSPGWRSHRRLLLAPVDEATRWVGPGDEIGDPSLNVRLVRAMMRVVAASQDTRIDPAIAEEWRADLKRELSSITEIVDFDQFARLQLIAMLFQGVFNNRPEEALAVITAVIAFGRPIQLRRLIAAIVSDRAGADPKGTIRLSLYQALTRFLAIDPGLKTQAAFRARTLLLEQLKATCLFSSNRDQAEAVTFLIESVRDQLHGAAGPGRQNSEFAELEDNGQGRYASSVTTDSWIAPGTAQLIALDQAGGRAQLVQHPRPLRNAANHFAIAPNARLPGPCLGVVESDSGSTPGNELTARFTPERAVSLAQVRAIPPCFGELIVIDSADPAGPTEQHALPPGTSIDVGEEKADALLARVCPKLRPGRLAALEISLLDENLLALGRTSHNFAWLAEGSREPYHVLLHSDGHADGKLPQPKVLDFGDLLISEQRTLLEENIVTLALQEVPQLGQELGSVVLERRPLERYEISLDFSMTADARRQLLAEIKRIAQEGRNPQGLLISFTVVATELGPQLKLASPDDGVGRLAYPELRLPYDDRNLWWRDRFEKLDDSTTIGEDRDEAGATMTVVWAQPTGPFQYVYDLGGRWNFPTALSIKIQERHTGSALIELQRRSWDPWNGAIFGSVEKAFALRLPKDRSLKSAAIRELDQLAPGDVLTLSPTNEIRDDGRIYCRTPTNLTVLVNAESVSMRRPCRPAENWPRNRKALLRSLNWQARGGPIDIATDLLPSDALIANRATGYLTAVPADVDQFALCQIAWLHGDGVDIIEGDIRIGVEPRGRIRLRAGSRVVFQVEGGRAKGRVQELIAIAEALWQQKDTTDTADDPPGEYIGSLHWAGESNDVFEVGGGIFSIRRSRDSHSSGRQSLQRFLGLDETRDYQEARDRASFGRVSYTSTGRRCALTVEEDPVPLAGSTIDEIIPGKVRITSLVLRRNITPLEGVFLLERRFRLLPEIEHTVTIPSFLDDPPDELANDQDRLMPGMEVEGRVTPPPRRLILRGLRRRGFPDGISIDPDRVQRAPFGPDEYYPGNFGRATIIAVEPAIGSFIDTIPRSLEDLRDALLAARGDDKSCILDPREIRLIFVGREPKRADPADGETINYVFEWGYGLWLTLPSSRIRYRGESIDMAEFVMFFGDTIAAAEVIDLEGNLTLSIEEICPSRAHDLYRHSWQHRVVNLLNVILDPDGSPAVISIEGFNPTVTFPNAEMCLPHARLDADTDAILRQRLRANESQRILARLDLEAFANTVGQTLMFSHVRLDLDDEKRGIVPGERVLVKAGEIILLPNDVALKVLDPGLHREDVHYSFRTKGGKGRLIQRRYFSLREQTLADILTLDGSDALKGRYLMVMVGMGARISLNEGSPPRSAAILRELIRRDGETLAIFGDPNNANEESTELRFELLPGVVVGLHANEVDGIDSLLQGDTVRLETDSNGRLRGSLASWSDLSFVVEGRPAVILPRQPLLRVESTPPYQDDEARRRARRSFSIGDLPALTGIAFDDSLSSDDRARDGQMTAFMSKPHPKLGQLIAVGKTRSSTNVRFRFGLQGNVFAGKIRTFRTGARKSASVEAVRTDLPRVSRVETDWYLLSYRDASANELETRLGLARWRFHDSHTTTWFHTRGGKLDARPDFVPPVTPAAGPLFFDLSAGRAKLRRDPHDLLKFACGPGAFLEPLREAGQSGASVQAVVASGIPDGLLVELWPGRIVQLPGGIARHVRHKASISLRQFAWHAFGPGDKVSIRSGFRQSALSPLELTLTWSHGARNAFGPNGALLQRDSRLDKAGDGAATYGAGSLRVQIPAMNIATLPSIAIVGGNAHLISFRSDLQTLVNCTILLIEDNEGQPAIHALPDVAIFPDEQWDWGDDDLMRPVMASSAGKPSFRADRLLERIRLAGGALAFTVAAVLTKPQRIVFLSRRHQQLKLDDGHLVLARIEGYLPDARLTQMRVGGCHFALAAEMLLPGITRTDLPLAFEALRDAGSEIWLQQTAGRLVCGHASAGFEALAVSPIAVIGRNDIFAGVICEGTMDGKLYWLPRQLAAACELSLSQARNVFKSSRLQRIQVARRPNGTVSALHHPKAAEELSRLKVGNSLFVDTLPLDITSVPFWNQLHTRPAWVSAVVQSKQSSVIFAAVAPPATLNRYAFQAEVVVRQIANGRLKILLTGAGERLVPSNAPAWLLGEQMPPWHEEEGVRHLHLSEDLDESAIVRWLSSGTFPDAETLTRAIGVYAGAPISSLLVGLSLAVACSAMEPKDETLNSSTVILLRNLFLRAISSLHLEWLAASALGRFEKMTPFTARWHAKMQRLFHSGRLEDAREACRRWLDIIALEEVPPEEAALAQAFAVMIGVSGNPMLVAKKAQFLPSVISATRPIYVARAPIGRIIDTTIEKLQSTALDLIDADHDIPIGQPIEFV